jgi:hypothetical protein
MSTFLSFHVKTSDRQNLCVLLKELSGLAQKGSGPLTGDYYERISYSSDARPDLLLVSKPENGWIHVLYNNFGKLHFWGEFISLSMHTTFIQLMGQTASDAYYFLQYINGALRREIDVLACDGLILTDTGDKYPFEQDPLLPDMSGESGISFDFETLERYCSHAGLDVAAFYKHMQQGEFCILEQPQML